MSPVDFESVRASRAASSYDAARRAFTAEGVPPSDASGYARYAVEPRLFDASRLELVASCDGDAIEVGRYRFRVVETPGHTPGHLALYEPESRILFGGDHVLFVISPSIALFPDGADGLQAYQPPGRQRRHPPREGRIGDQSVFLKGGVSERETPFGAVRWKSVPNALRGAMVE